MNEPLVFICIPTYRGAQFISAAIDSVLSQSHRNIKLLVLDDNSPDDTYSIIMGYSDSRLEYVKNEKNLGPEGNWSRGLALATGKYFKLLPHDDVLAPDSLQRQVNILESDRKEEIALVFGLRKIIDPGGKIIMSRSISGVKEGKISADEIMSRCVRAGTNLIGEPGNGLFRTKLIPLVGTYDARYAYLVDLDYWFRILLHGDGYYSESHTSSFRICPGSWSVSIGSGQYMDFKGFVNKFYEDRRFKIRRFDRRLGFLRARFNTFARMVVYRYLFGSK